MSMNLIPYGGERGVAEAMRAGRPGPPRGAPPSSTPGLFDPNRLLSILRRRLRLMAAVAALVFLLVLIPTLMSPRMYTATSLVVLDMRQEQITNSPAVLPNLPDNSNIVDTQVEILKSRELAEHVMDKLNLDADPEFGGDPTLSAAADKVERAATAGTPVIYSPAEMERRSAVVDAVAAGLRVQRVGLTYMISVSFNSVDPQKAARIADAYADQYIAEQLDAKFDARREANTWLASKLQQMEGEVVRAQAAVEQYKIAHNLMSSSGETITEQEVSQYNQQMTAARTQEVEAEARLSAARKALGSGGGPGTAVDSPLLQSLRGKRAEVSAKLADYNSRFGAKYPDTVAANRQLADIDSQIDAETNRVLADLQAQAMVARQRTAAIESSLSGARGALASNNRASVGLDQLQREADSTRTLYEGLLSRYKETSSEAGLEHSDARLVSRASVPSLPSSPNIPLGIALGFIAALGASTVAVAAAEFLDSSFGTGDEIERRLGMPHLGSIPDLVSLGTTEQPHIYITSRPLSAFAESFRSLRTTLLHGYVRAPKAIAISSALPGEGKTITAVCLAKSAAQAGDKVVVVDCDLRRRKLSTSLGIKPKVGLVEVLMGKADLESALVYDNPTGVGILPLTSDKVPAEDLFGSDAMANLLNELRDRFDLVVLDTAPVLALADTRALVSHVDAIVLLARWRKTPQKALEHAIRLLRGAEGRIAGVMLSQVDINQQRRQGYGDATFYSGAYEKYYVG